ncbi:MAG: DUF177 domain-containing protein [Aliishimia sp.]
MTQTTHSPYAIRVLDLPQSAEHKFEVVPTKSEMMELQGDLDLLDLSKVRLVGTLRPIGKSDWQFDATLGATVVQTCVATLEPVRTRIDTTVERLFMKFYDDPDTPEAEMPDEDHVERLLSHIDPMVVLGEALSLALPVYPRASDTDPVEIRLTEPGKTAMSDDDAKPFAGLAALKSQLEDPKDT